MIFDDDTPEASEPGQQEFAEEPSGEMAAATSGDDAAADPVSDTPAGGEAGMPPAADGPSLESAADDGGADEPAAAEAVSDLGQQVIDLVADQLSEDVSNITPASRFQDDLKADSLDLVELVMTFEDKFGINVPDEDYEKIVSVGDAITYIDSKRTKSCPSGHECASNASRCPQCGHQFV